jgi:SAM-dependent methyltransferase
MSFRHDFDCLWCGRPHTVRRDDDLEGWAQLCPDCLGKAGENGFLRARLKTAIDERARAGSGGSAAAVEGLSSEEAGGAEPGDEAGAIATAMSATATATLDPEAALLPYYSARAAEYDDWYLRRGRYARGAIHDTAWNAELDAAGTWLDSQPMRGQIVDLAAGTGWWSTLLASKGELSLYDANEAPLERARERLVAHGLRAHLHVRDAWAEPDRQVDAVFTGFWLSHVPRTRLAAFLGLVARWLKPGGRFACIDSLQDPQSSATDHPTPTDDLSVRRLDDGREFTIVKVYYTPDELRSALDAAGFDDIEITTTGRFFLLGSARRADRP